MPPTALLVIDIQRAAFDGVHCPPIDRPDVLVGNACVLVDAARASGTPIVFVQHCEGKGEPFEEGSPHGEFHDQARRARRLAQATPRERRLLSVLVRPECKWLPGNFGVPAYA